MNILQSIGEGFLKVIDDLFTGCSMPPDEVAAEEFEPCNPITDEQCREDTFRAIPDYVAFGFGVLPMVTGILARSAVDLLPPVRDGLAEMDNNAVDWLTSHDYEACNPLASWDCALGTIAAPTDVLGDVFWDAISIF